MCLSVRIIHAFIIHISIILIPPCTFLYVSSPSLHERVNLCDVHGARLAAGERHDGVVAGVDGILEHMRGGDVIGCSERLL